jgi:NADPH:quinone reductase-like Zn-dependent oxidoreductase
MKAIQMTETGVPEVLRLVEIPDPTPGPGEVLIKVESAAVAIAGLPIQTFPLAEPPRPTACSRTARPSAS